MSDPNAPTKPRIVRLRMGSRASSGSVENGVVQPITLNPGAQVPTAIDRLERAARLAGGIPAEFGQERPQQHPHWQAQARRWLWGDTVDMRRSREYQQIPAGCPMTPRGPAEPCGR